jgi:pilus assembly protein Flp/PilA
MKALIKRLMRDTLGATAIEYGLILALVFIAIVGSLEAFAGANLNTWNSISTAMADAVATGTGG